MTPSDSLQNAFLTPNHSQDSMQSLGAYRTSVEYIHWFPCQVHIRHRDGLLATVAPAPATEGQPGILLITKEYSGAASCVKFNSDGLLNASSSNTLERDILYTALSKNSKTFTGARRARVTYALTAKELSAKGGSLYLPEIDVVISIVTDPTKVPLHPHSYENRNHPKSVGESIDFELVDNTGTLGDRYMRFMDGVVKLTPRRNIELSDGLHVRFGLLLRNNDSTPKDKHVHIPMSELEGDHPYASFPTWDLLQNRIREQDKEARLAELEKSKFQQDQVRAEREKEILELKHGAQTQEMKLTAAKEELKLAMAKADAARQEAEAARKDYYEKKSYERKDSSDWWKFVITVAGLGLAIWKR